MVHIKSFGLNIFLEQKNYTTENCDLHNKQVRILAQSCECKVTKAKYDYADVYSLHIFYKLQKIIFYCFDFN